jgi:hypothetical protein
VNRTLGGAIGDPTPPVEQTIVFETLIDGQPVQYEARVEETPFPRSRLAKGQMVVEHSSGDYAISIDVRDGEYVANPVTDNA